MVEWKPEMGVKRWMKFCSVSSARQPWEAEDQRLHQQVDNQKDGHSLLILAYCALSELPDGLHSPTVIAAYIHSRLKQQCISEDKKTFRTSSGRCVTVVRPPDELMPTDKRKNPCPASLVSQVLSSQIVRLRDDSAFRRHEGYFCLARRERDAFVATLVTEEYRARGMTLLFPSLVKYIPFESEYKFLEVKPSTILGAGLGLFLRMGFEVNSGTILCEYTGTVSDSPPREGESYTVRRQDGKYICGLRTGVDCQVTGFAPLANDNGDKSNSVLKEFEDDAPGKIFIVSTKSIQGGAEIMTQYGASFWGDFSSYKEIDVKSTRCQKRSSKMILLPSAEPNMTFTCRTCRRTLSQKIRSIHYENYHQHEYRCREELVSKLPLIRIPNSLPYNDFTRTPSGAKAAKTRAEDLANRRRAAYFVTGSEFDEFYTHDELVDFEVEDDTPTENEQKQRSKKTKKRSRSD